MRGDVFEQYASLGFAVFPVNSRKAPVTPHGFKDAVVHPKQAAELFRAHKGTGLGIATGWLSGGLLVIDVDDRRGGDDSLTALETELGGTLPSSVRCKTPSGGQHIYFKIPRGVVVGSSVDFRPGIDIRADGGYVVAPPSPKYYWELSCDPSENPIADAPERLLALLVASQRTKSEGKGWESGGFVLPPEIGPGERDNLLTKFAGQLRRGGLDTELIFEMLQQANVLHCHPPLENRDLKRIARSIGSKPTGEDQSKKWTDLVDQVADDGGVIPGYVDRDNLLARLRAYSGLESVTTGFPLMDKHLGGGLWTTQTAILVAPTGSGKTALALQLARTAAKRRPVVIWTMEMDAAFLAARTVAHEANEYYLDLVRDVDLHERVVECAAENVSYYDGRKIEDLVRVVRRVRKAWGDEIAPLIVVDYLQKLGVGADTAELRSRIADASEALRSMAMKLGCPLLAISSASRAGVQMLRKALDHDPEELVGLGKESGEIEYDANAVITIGLEAAQLEDEDDELPEWRDAVVTVAKGRFGPGQVHLAYRFNGRTGAWEELGYITKATKNTSRAEQAVINAIQEAGGSARSKRALIALVPMRTKAVLEAINSLVLAGVLEVNDASNEVTLVKRVIQ